MTQQEIDSIRAQYKYNPATLVTDDVSSPMKSPNRYADAFGEQTPVEQKNKTTLQKVGDFAGAIVNPVERLGGTVAQGIKELTVGQGQNDLFKNNQATGLFNNKIDLLGTKDGQVLDNTGTAKDIAGNVLQNVAVATPGASGFKALTKTGAITGAEFGAGSALQNQEDAMGVAIGATGGAVLGGAFGAGASAIGKGAVALKNKLNPSEKFIESQIVKTFTKGVKPILPGKTTPRLLNDYNDNVVTAVKAIKNNKSNLSFTDELGDAITGQTPKSLNQLNNALEQTKKTIFGQYDALTKQAGQKGLSIEVGPIASELDSVINNKALGITHPDAIKYAQATKDRLTTIGKVDAQTAQDVVQNYNQSLDAFYKNPSYDSASKVAIDSVIANNFRKALDNGIEGITGAQYSALKRQYGALKAVERDVIKASLRDARKNTVGLIDFTDVFSGGQVASGILSMNPAQIATGLTQKSIAAFYKLRNDPNRAISKMFEAAETPVGGIVKKLSKSPRGFVNPAEVFKTNSAKINNIAKTMSGDDADIIREYLRAYRAGEPSPKGFSATFKAMKVNFKTKEDQATFLNKILEQFDSTN